MVQPREGNPNESDQAPKTPKEKLKDKLEEVRCRVLREKDGGIAYKACASNLGGVWNQNDESSRAKIREIILLMREIEKDELDGAEKNDIDQALNLFYGKTGASL